MPAGFTQCIPVTVHTVQSQLSEVVFYGHINTN
jgi:hypothetical protein